MKDSSNKKLFRVEFIETGRTGIVESGSTIMDAAQKAGVYINSICGGEGLCGKCRVFIEEGRVFLKANPFIEGGEVKKGYVIACLSEVLSNLRVKIPVESSIDEKLKFDENHLKGIIRSGEFSLKYPYNPLYRKQYLELAVPSISDSISDFERVQQEFKRTTGIQIQQVGLECIRTLPRVLRESGFRITVAYVVKDDAYEITGFESGKKCGDSYGIAVDLGTTTVMANLIDLNEKKICGSAASYNSQMQYGEDVISRIVYAQENEGGLNELNRLVVNDIDTLTKTLVNNAGLHRDDIKYMICTGNSIMIHILLGITPENIRKEPYILVIGDPPAIHAEEIGVEISRQGYLGFLPGFGGYVGSDITAAIIASGMAHEKEVCLLIDVGTNGEIVLGCEDWFICCSASAGPAFEGAGTSCGMRATSGAIEKVCINDKGNVDIGIIGGETCKPAGICGSGFIDLVAELFKAGFLDRTGRFRKDNNSTRIRRNEFGPEFLVVEKEYSATGKDIIITENDIITLIRTKGAIFTAAEAVLKHVGLAWSNIHMIFISGGFGNFLDIEQSITIGLLPDLDREKFHFIGNGSIAGAQICLLSENALKLAREIAHKMTYFDLSTDVWFMNEYTSSLFLPHTYVEKFPTVVSPEIR